ncbi:Uncharacterised protein [Streptococcus pneumoniae]|nr:Uncharacterised protein [Streptococcus pneumoniae]
MIIELEDFKKAWAALADNYTEFLVSLMLILKFSLLKWVWNYKEIEISKGEIIKNIVNENFTNYSWDVPFSRLGG